jgi:hypothetical protein
MGLMLLGQVRHMAPPAHRPIVNSPVPPIARPGVQVVPGFAPQPRFQPQPRLQPQPRFQAVRPRPARPVVRSPRASYGFYPGVPFISYYPAPEVQAPSTPVAVEPAYSSDLTLEIRQLSDELRQLRNELSEIKATPVPDGDGRRLDAPPSAPPTPVMLIFKDNQRLETNGYAIVGPTLWVFGDSGWREFRVADLDLAATKAENLQRGTSFRAP